MYYAFIEAMKDAGKPEELPEIGGYLLVQWFGAEPNTPRKVGRKLWKMQYRPPGTEEASWLSSPADYFQEDEQTLLVSCVHEGIIPRAEWTPTYADPTCLTDVAMLSRLAELVPAPEESAAKQGLMSRIKQRWAGWQWAPSTTHWSG
jgi:hypothetical protein